MPPIVPGSAVKVTNRSTFSSAATAATPSGMPIPKIDHSAQGKFEAAAARDDPALVQRQLLDPVQRHPQLPGQGRTVRRRSRSARGSPDERRPRNPRECPGICTALGLSDPSSASRSTCTMTSPREFRAAIAIASVSNVSASRSIVMLPARFRRGPANERDLDRERLIEEPLLTVHLDQPDESPPSSSC